MRRNTTLDCHPRLVVERGRVIHEEAIFQRAETRIDVVETRVSQSDRDNFRVEERTDFLMRFDFGAEAIPCPQPGAATVDKTVARSFEADLFVKIEQFESVIDKPFLEMLFFRSALVRHEVTGDGLVTVNDTGIGSENHIRKFGLRIHHNDVGEFSHLVAQLVPLLLCPLEAQRLFVPRHPRVDDVFDREEIRRTHQYLVFAGCHFFFYFLGKTKREPVARFPSRDNALSKF